MERRLDLGKNYQISKELYDQYGGDVPEFWAAVKDGTEVVGVGENHRKLTATIISVYGRGANSIKFVPVLPPRVSESNK